MWAVGWAAGAYRDRWERHAGGRCRDRRRAGAGVAARRGAERPRGVDAGAGWSGSCSEHYGSFTFDEAWGYHGPFGSTRVFVSVRHVLETTTAVLSRRRCCRASRSPTRSRSTSRRYRRRARSAASRSPPSAASCGPSTRGDRRRPRPGGAAAAIDAVAELGDGEDERLQAAHGGRRYADLTGGGRPRPLRRRDQRRGRVAGPVQHVRRVDAEPERRPRPPATAQMPAQAAPGAGASVAPVSRRRSYSARPTRR